jgi:hypothetical protein
MAKKKGGVTSEQWDSVIKITQEYDFDPKIAQEMAAASDSFKKNLVRGAVAIHDSVQFSKREVEKMMAKQRQFSKEEMALKGRTDKGAERDRVRLLKLQKQEIQGIERLAQAREDLAREGASAARRSKTDRLSGALGAPGTLAQAVRGADFSLLSRMGNALAARAAHNTQEGKGGKANTVMGLGGAGLMKAGVIGAAAYGLYNVVMDITDSLATLNKSIMQAGISIGSYASGGGAGAAFREVRQSGIGGDGALGFLNKWNMDAETHFGILGSFEKTGYDLKEMTAGLETATERMERFREVSERAVVYGTLGFESAEEAATHMADAMDDLSVSLDSVSEKMAAVYAHAVDSGFGTKRFFSTVLQATAGMSMYNIRLEETAGLLAKLGKFMSSKEAGKLLQGLVSWGTGLSTEDSVKVGTIVGDKFLQKLYKGATDASVRELFQAIGDNPAFLDSAARHAGVEGGMTSANLVDRLKAMSPDQLAAFSAYVKATGDGTGRALDRLTQFIDTDNESQRLANISLLSPADFLALQIKAATHGSNRQLHDVMNQEGVEGVMRLKGMSGKSEADIRALAEFTKGAADAFTAMQKLIGQELSPEVAAWHARKWGLGIKDSKVVGARMSGDSIEYGDPIGSVEDYYSHAAALQDLSKLEDENTRLAREIASATTTMSDTLSRAVSGVFADIAAGIEGLFQWFTKDSLKEDDFFTQMGKFDFVGALSNARKDIDTEAKEMERLNGLIANAPLGGERDELIAQRAAVARRLTARRGLEDRLRSGQAAHKMVAMGATPQEALKAHPGIWSLYDMMGLSPTRTTVSGGGATDEYFTGEEAVGWGPGSKELIAAAGYSLSGALAARLTAMKPGGTFDPVGEMEKLNREYLRTSGKLKDIHPTEIRTQAEQMVAGTMRAPTPELEERALELRTLTGLLAKSAGVTINNNSVIAIPSETGLHKLIGELLNGKR